MCGIAGIVDLKGQTSAESLSSNAQAMNDAISHRGPDGEDIWVSPEDGVALAHRRLAIVDLTPTGKQPMHSACGRFCLTYNGEIYNAEDIRQQLDLPSDSFRGTSDTEVLVEAIAQWGLLEALKKCIGMFALALWDKKDKSLSLARDRLGIKPIYWHKSDSLFLFGSELKSLCSLPQLNLRIDRSSVASYLRFNYVPTPHCIYEEVHKLEPGTILTMSTNREIKKQRFWDPVAVARAGRANPLTGTDMEAIDQLEELLADAVRRRMVADVPLGAFLSGGIDSSLVVSLMQKASSSPVETFSIGFQEESYNEAAHAKAVAKHLGTSHNELYVTSQDSLDVIPRLAQMYDEPFADSSQIPTFLVNQLSRGKVTVALSGDGGDELFGGYNRYVWGSQIQKYSNMLPYFMRRLIEQGILKLNPRTLDKLMSPLTGSFLPQQIGDKIHKAAPLFSHRDPIEMYRHLVTHWQDITPGVDESIPSGWRLEELGGEMDLIASMQLLDSQTYMPDDILTKVDRASMAVAMEVRVPILDHRVYELSWRLPAHLKNHDGTGKIALRRILDRYVPSELINRPKTGFGIPLSEWLRGPLRDWARELIENDVLYHEMGLDRAAVMRRWDEHERQVRNWPHHLWSILMLSDWHGKCHLQSAPVASAA